MFRVEKSKLTFLLLALVTFSFSMFAGDYAIVRHMEGKAYVQGSESNERESLSMNSPIFEGDNIWVVDGSLGILFGDGSLIWLSSDSHLEITRFPDPVPNPPYGMKAHLWRGMMLLEVPASLPGESTHFIMTPAAMVKAYRKGLSLVEVETVDRTRLTVLEGSAVIGGNGQYVIVNQGEMSYSEYGYEPMSPVSAGSLSYPEIVAFRDLSIARPVRNGRSREYVDPGLYPYADDLDYYGAWQDVPSYGHVWFPSPGYLSAGWNPYYNNGYWHYTPWGATWISYEPWGWVPFHYGRWTFVIGVGWGWIPDVYFSPAWVSWYWGDGWIGWCPLGYYGPLWEPCGWYSVTINNIYVTNVTKVVNVNKQGPPPGKPIIPVSKDGSGSVNIKKLQQKGQGDILVTPRGGLNLHPAKLQDLQSRKLSVDDLKQVVSETPLSMRDRRATTASSLDRSDDPVVGKGAVGTPSSFDRPVPSSPRARNNWDRDDNSTRETPGNSEGPSRNLEPGTRAHDDDRYQPSREPSVSRDFQRQDEPSRETPAREIPSRNVQPQREQPGTQREAPRNAEPQREQPRASDSPRSDSRSSESRSVSPPPSAYTPPSSPPPSTSDNQSKSSKQRSSAGASTGRNSAAKTFSGAMRGAVRTGNKSSAGSKSGSSGRSSSGSKKQKNRV